ncbi:MAG: 50S ribosomal protein L25 [Vampirovibrionia bacterium]
MSSNIPKIQVKARDMSINPRMLRRDGRLPATVYGNKMDPVSIDLDNKSFTYLYRTQTLHLVSLEKEGKNLTVLVKKVQTDPITQELLNVEFLQVSADHKVSLKVPVVLEGEAPVYKKGSTLLQILDSIDVSCLPSAIPEKLVYDMTTIKEVDLTVTVVDFTYPDGVETTMPDTTAVFRICSAKGVAIASDDEDSEAGVKEEAVAAS